MRPPRILAAVVNVRMSLGHDALTDIAKKLGVNMAKISGEELVVFINRKRDRLKLLGSNGVVLGYLKMPDGERLPTDAIQYIPRAFGSDGEINMNVALTEYIRDRLAKKARVSEEQEFLKR